MYALPQSQVKIGDGFRTAPQDVSEAGPVSELSSGVAPGHCSTVLDSLRHQERVRFCSGIYDRCTFACLTD